MTNSLAGSAQKFFPGPPSGSARDGVIAFDTTTTPWTAYVMFQGTWQVFGGAGAAPSPANPTAIAGPVAINGSASTYMRSDAAPAIQKASNVAYGIVAVDGTTITSAGGVISASGGATGANPTATAGPAAINGVATTFMRSDAAPAVQLGSAAVPGIVQVDGTTITATSGVISGAASVTPANPTATAGPNAINGSSSHFMRADASPAVQLGSASVPGLLQGDGSTVSIAAGVLSVPAATTTQQGSVTIDNTTIKITGNKIGAIPSVLFPHPGFVAGRLYTLPYQGTPSAVTLVANTLYAIPIYVPNSVTITTVSFFLSATSSGNHIEVGIYNNNNGNPGSLLLDCGTFTMTAANGLHSLTISQAMQGWYWLALASDATPGLDGGSLPPMTNFLGYLSGNLAATNLQLTGAWTFSAGNLPGTFPSPTVAAGNFPLIWINF